VAREAVVIVNRRSRRSAHELERLHALLAAQHVPVAAFHIVAGSTELRRCAKRAAKAGVPAVIAGGGDGTLAHAVDALAHSETVLGVVPLGTGNSFAQSLGLDAHDVDAAVGVIARGNVARIDLGRVNGTHFANFATIGISSEIADATQTSVKRWAGPLAYAFASLRQLFTHRSFRARIRWKGGRLDVRTRDIIVANGRFFGSTPVSPHASLTDGRLALYTRDDGSRSGALRTYAAFATKTQGALRGAHVVTAPRFEIRTRSKQKICIDGSFLGVTPARFRVERAALRVFVPENGVARG
jgi:YegS/Rv2252/BmrU family lipid kinase